MKPTMPDKFINILDEKIEELAKEVSSATYYTLCRIHLEADPEIWEKEEEEGEYSKDIYYLYEAYSTIEGSQLAIKQTLAHCTYPEEDFHFGKGDNSYYPDKESFLADIDHAKIVEVINQCWNDSCNPIEEN